MFCSCVLQLPSSKPGYNSEIHMVKSFVTDRRLSSNFDNIFERLVFDSYRLIGAADLVWRNLTAGQICDIESIQVLQQEQGSVPGGVQIEKSCGNVRGWTF